MDEDKSFDEYCRILREKYIKNSIEEEKENLYNEIDNIY